MDLTKANEKPTERSFISYNLIDGMWGANGELIGISLTDGAIWFTHRIDRMDTMGMHAEFFQDNPEQQ